MEKRSSEVESALRQIEAQCRSGAVRTEVEWLERCSHDASEVEAQQPAAVLVPGDAAEVAVMLRAASEHGVPVTTRGGGTSRVGGAVPSRGGLVLATEGLRRLVDVDAANRIVIAQPGLHTDALHAAVEAEGLYYPPDPNSLDACTLGGNVGTNAAGPRAFKYGPTRDYVLGLEAVTADGQILRLGKRTLKGVVGYDLCSLLVGSEGTLAVITEVTCKLLPLPEEVRTLLVFLKDAVAMQRSIVAVQQQRLRPRCIEMLDALALALIRPQAGLAVPEEAGAMLIIEFDGAAAQLDDEVQRCGDALAAAGALEVLVAVKAGERQRLWAGRRALSYTMRDQARFKLSEDVVVPLSRLAELLRCCEQLAEQQGIRMPTYGHAGDGNLHVNFLWDDEAQRPQVDEAVRRLFETVIGMGGTLSGEHGIGVLKRPYLPLEQSAGLIELQQRIKQLFDPRGILNPGKIFNPARPHGAC